MTAQQLAAAPHKRHAGRKATSHILVGGLCGLAWAAGLRGFMAQVAHAGVVLEQAGDAALEAVQLGEGPAERNSQRVHTAGENV
jgi:hypothetical protein